MKSTATILAPAMFGGDRTMASPSLAGAAVVHQTSSCRSSSLEQSARGRHLIVITENFPSTFKNSSFPIVITDFLTVRLTLLQWFL